MEMLPIINSSQLAAAGWEDDTLRIQFSSGSTYEYANVRNSLFQELMSAPKASAVFNSKIKNHPEKYPYTKL